MFCSSSAPQVDSDDGTASVLNVAAYQFAQLGELAELRRELKELCFRIGLKGTILLSEEGINLFVAGERDDIDGLLGFLRRVPGLAGLEVKESWTAQQPFRRMLVKIKREIIAFGVDSVQPAVRTSPKLSAATLRRWLSEGKPITLLDTRNDYEVQLGTFRNAIDLNIRDFRSFPEAAEKLPEETKGQAVVMFCTGGIRCEKAGPYLEQLGFREIYQLDGGILKYFEECGGEHYDGACFVFDQRVAVGPDLLPTGVKQCFACQATLGEEELRSPQYVPGESCPHCYLPPQQQRLRQLQKRQEKLDGIASQLPGCVPYPNVRAMHVPRALAGLSALDYLTRFYPGIDRAGWQEALANSAVRYRGEAIDAETAVREGQRLEHHEGIVVEPAVATDIRILFEDESIVVIDKPAPLPVHPCGRFNRNSLESFLAQAYRPEKLRMAHRLDANTSGLMVFSRKFSIAQKLQDQFHQRTVEKRYLASVHGLPPHDAFVCREPIGREAGEHGARTIDAGGLVAETGFRVLRRMADGTSLLLVEPLTGRTNQIRVHLWHLGIPIVGDSLYLPGRQLGNQATRVADSAPMCLHAWALAFDHPLTGERLRLRSSRQLAWATSLDGPARQPCEPVFPPEGGR
ncbi:MAG: sulfurtransferase [Planctomycetaceae bacterium]|nr:MAG: sulfurtransferase [Planctomycetaceae bacterium]